MGRNRQPLRQGSCMSPAPRLGRLNIVCLFLVALAMTLPIGAMAASAAGTGQIGVVGCSVTNQSAVGYNAETTSNKSMWVNDIGGGNVRTWATQADTSKWWVAFDTSLVSLGANKIWVQLCVVKLNTAKFTLEQHGVFVQTIYDRIRLRTAVPIVVSPGPSFVQDVCDRIGPMETEWAISLADSIAASRQVTRGPDIGPMPTNLLSADLCHFTTAGREFAGSQLAAYFVNG